MAFLLTDVNMGIEQMLAQNFKSAADLGITEPQLSALKKTLVLLETGKLAHVAIADLAETRGAPVFSGEFNMECFAYRHECGTACCIAGTAELISGVEFVGMDRPMALHDLFFMDRCENTDMGDVTPAQAATALRSYLTTGDAKWREAVA